MVSRKDLKLLRMYDQAADELRSGTWDILGWCKSVSTSEEVTVHTPKCHIVTFRRHTGYQIRKLIFTETEMRATTGPSWHGELSPGDDNQQERMFGVVRSPDPTFGGAPVMAIDCESSVQLSRQTWRKNLKIDQNAKKHENCQNDVIFTG